MAIEMPNRFEDIYHYREGKDKWFYDKINEIVTSINGGTEGNTSTVTITVKDDNGDAVQGATVTLTSGSNTYSSNATGSKGGSTITDVPYGTYGISVTAPSGYTTLAKYNKLNVNAESESLTVIVNKN